MEKRILPIVNIFTLYMVVCVYACMHIHMRIPVCVCVCAMCDFSLAAIQNGMTKVQEKHFISAKAKASCRSYIIKQGGNPKSQRNRKATNDGT